MTLQRRERRITRGRGNRFTPALQERRTGSRAVVVYQNIGIPRFWAKVIEDVNFPAQKGDSHSTTTETFTTTKYSTSAAVATATTTTHK